MTDAGDSAVVLRLGREIDPDTNEHAWRVAERLRGGPLPVRDVVLGYASVTVYFDPLEVNSARIREELTKALARADEGTAREPGHITVPVTYGGAEGPDLDEVAAFARCSPGEVVARHLAREYRVFMLGFLPGFPYMGTVDDRIAMPRRDTPRVAVPAGSVGIAGRQTGIYPVESPGGWRLIGRTDVTLFDPGSSRPTLFRPGDRVSFVRAPGK